MTLWMLACSQADGAAAIAVLPCAVSVSAAEGSSVIPQLSQNALFTSDQVKCPCSTAGLSLLCPASCLIRIAHSR